MILHTTPGYPQVPRAFVSRLAAPSPYGALLPPAGSPPPTTNPPPPSPSYPLPWAHLEPGLSPPGVPQRQLSAGSSRGAPPCLSPVYVSLKHASLPATILVLLLACLLQGRLLFAVPEYNISMKQIPVSSVMAPLFSSIYRCKLGLAL